MSSIDSCVFGHLQCPEKEDHDKVFALFVECENDAKARELSLSAKSSEKAEEKEDQEKDGGMNAQSDPVVEIKKEPLKSDTAPPVSQASANQSLVPARSEAVPVLAGGSSGPPSKGGSKKKEGQGLGSQKWETPWYSQGVSAYDRQREITQAVIWFRSEEHPLSNLYQHGLCRGVCIIRYRGFGFQTSEHAYQFEKARRHGIFDLCLRILGPLQGVHYVRKVMKLGQALATLPIWKSRDKLVVMDEIITTKLHVCAGYRNCLEESGEALLNEQTCGHFWGAKWNTHKNKWGENQLGKLHMRKREGLRSAFCPDGASARPVPVGLPPYVEARQYPRDWNTVPQDVILRLEGVPGWERESYFD